ncbi:calcium-binding protein [Methylobacterium sp. R2-1]|uniref:calcium-binding protein n=1 Tax=Methylobacterium sp. R2-1 TaxID=2587064 RepID=UPI00161F0733|nr:calcium-binding protein [Methylobacterium sp. R2-1]MBB2964476.1 Ca2+-binding RTX toxin-like protein [Methylobacterium sp. R2-1]
MTIGSLTCASTTETVEDATPSVLYLFERILPNNEKSGVTSATVPMAYAFVYGPDTADLFERASEIVHPKNNGTLQQPQIRDGWRTYNFEVEELHTYIADGIRVHNASVFDLMPNDAKNIRNIQDTDNDGLPDTVTYNRSNGVEETIKGIHVNGTTIQLEKTVSIDRYDLLGSHDKVRWKETYQGASTEPVQKEAVSIEYANGSLQGEEIGRTLGSVLGSALGTQSVFAQVGSATIASTLLQNIGEFLHKDVDFSLLAARGKNANPLEAAVKDTFQDLGRDLKGNALLQVNNALSGILVGEIADVLNLHGFEKGIFSTAGNTVTNQVLGNISVMLGLGEPPAGVLRADVNLLHGFDAANMAVNVANSLGGYFGTQLGSLAVQPKSPQSALFGSAASAVASYVLSTVGFAIPVIGPLIGAFAGQALGNLIGNALWDDDRLAHYTLYTDANGVVQYGYPYTQDGASLVLSEYLARTARDSINNVYGEASSHIDPSHAFSPFQMGWYVNSQNQKIMFADGTTYQAAYNVHETQGIISAAVNHAISRSEIAGGDIFIQRAYAMSHQAGLVQLSFDLQVAEDFVKYLDNTRVINSIIADSPNSDFSAGWVATLQRARELSLDKVVGFEPMAYLASYGDLQNTYGTDTRAATRHFFDYGIGEGRQVSFDAASYRAANADVQAAFGNDLEAVARHYVQYGRNEGWRSAFWFGGPDERTVTGGVGTDTISYADTSVKMTIDLQAQRTWNGTFGDTLVSIENAIGSRFDDTFITGAATRRMEGRDGNDGFHVAEANDITVDGGAGSDTISYETSTRAGYVINLHAGQTSNGSRSDWLVSIENAVGSNFSDTLIAGRTTGWLQGRDGDDTFLVIDSNGSSLDGGNGIDTVSYEQANTSYNIALNVGLTYNGSQGEFLASIENAVGSRFNDTFTAGNGTTRLEGRDGDDTFLVNVSNHISVQGGNGTDTISYENAGTAYTVDLNAQMTSDRVRSGEFLASIENAVGSRFNDTLISGVGTTRLDGRDGDDVLRVVPGNISRIILDGGNGSDTVSYEDAGTGYYIDLSAQETWNFGNRGDKLVSIENAIGTRFNDRLDGAAGNNLLRGGAGNDIINGWDGNDELDGGDFEDVISGGNGDDLLIGGNGFDTLRGDAGNDTLYGGNEDDTLDGGSGNNILDGGIGTDTATFENAATGYTIDLNAQRTWNGSVGDILASIENAVGSRFNDTLISGVGTTRLDGRDGDDVLRVVPGNISRIILDGGNGSDTVSYEDAGTGYYIDLSAQETWNFGNRGDKLVSIENAIGTRFNDRLDGAAGNNLLRGGAGNDIINGWDGNDELDGGDFEDVLSGGAGNDVLIGGSGNDTIYGGMGNDIVYGGDGNDTISDLAGNDVIYGGSGSDTFVFAKKDFGTPDYIKDFTVGLDILYIDDFQGFDDYYDGVLAENMFKDTTKAPIDADDIMLYNGSTGELFYDVDGGGSAARVLFAILENNIAISHRDIWIYSD